MKSHWINADWPAPTHVRAGTSLRTGGASTGRYASLNLATHVGDAVEHVEQNRARFIKENAMPASPVWLTQVHGTNIISLDEKVISAIDADGSYTQSQQKICTILTADCVPLLFCDKQGNQIAAIHAGWRGICSGIIDAAVKLYPDPAEILVWIGPCISKDCYEVGSDVLEASSRYLPNSDAAFQQNDATHWQCDLVELVRIALRRLAVEHVYASGLCTYSRPDLFYSYRRDGITGRTASLIWME